jgi:hypothetical protein
VRCQSLILCRSLAIAFHFSPLLRASWNCCDSRFDPYRTTSCVQLMSIMLCDQLWMGSRKRNLRKVSEQYLYISTHTNVKTAHVLNRMSGWIGRERDGRWE